MFRMSLRIVFYKEDGEWVARCLEFNLVGTGKTKLQAAKRLAEAIDCQMHATIRHRNPENLFHPADGKYFSMFAAGKDIAVAAFQLKLEKIEKELEGGYDFHDISAREVLPTRRRQVVFA